MKFGFAISLALLGLAQSAGAQTAEPVKCLSIMQAEALVTYLLPKAVDASRVACSASLPATSPLMIANSERLAKYRAASESAWPKAKSAVSVLAGERLPPGIDDALLRPIADAMFTQLIGQEIKQKDCALIGKIYGDLAPMPSANLASLAITIVQASEKEGKRRDIPICKAPA
ncbi:MAG: hypothetical protein GW808_13930 [Sphingomonadales bacterium]|nr:hypothetical protein [Sphingomonadales bacterium]PIX66338.1 MAG: hypothetical protein COZ43_07155 [Sphingomonadales bacterium CG_4_10_14_3_um_filter_58_15]NCO50313.1 hypothetical protein [Sphingomonadales bacterium]NCP00324.1 hypothetical protein [Sphingomonadales bacterium]NCP25993.1 hypothetical protein [Sphingomonadales bacterium]